MRLFLPKPPSQLILEQELKLAARNYIPGMLLYSLAGLLITYLIYQETKEFLVLVWLALMIISAIGFSIYFFFIRTNFGQHPRPDLLKLLALLGFHSLGFTYLIYHCIPVVSYELVITLAVISIALAAGAVSLTAPLLPAFYVLAYPSVMTLVVSLYHRPEPAFLWIGIGCFGMIIGLTWFAIIMANTIRLSIETGFQKELLVKKLRSALIQTDEANRAKSVFLASASHDLRQPLHALGLLTETLGRTELNQQQNEIHEHMLSAVDSTRTMLDSLLNISKLDAGAIMAEPKAFLVQSIFSKLEAELAPIADENKLIYRTRETITAAYSDPQIVELILRNLIANAIRYTDSGGLLVACRARGQKKLVIEVWDTGVGIPESKVEDMFREFQQLDNPERDSTKGFGLGLSIAQGLAKTLDSNIEVSSIVNRGSVFRFELPRSTQTIIDDLPTQSQTSDFEGLSVVVIDDDQRVRESMHGLMRSWGCNCISGESADEVLGQLENETKIDLLLVDYRLREGLTGRDAIDKIRTELGTNIPAIIITGDTAADRIAEAQSSDALLIHKPASTRQLRRMMNRLVGPQE